MTTQALAHGRPDLLDLAPDAFSPARGNTLRDKKSRKQHKSVANTAHLPWNTVPLQQSIAVSNNLGVIKRPPTYAGLLAAAAVLIHAGLGWYFSTHTHGNVVKPKPAEVALQFERPKPPEPKIEPPKPQEQKVRPKQAQVLPTIQTAAPQPSDTPAVASAEPPVAVAPIVSAPPAPEPPAPITAPIGRAGYLNNPAPEYPPMALRQGWQGIVVLHVHVQANGKPDVVEVQKSSGRKVLDDEAVRTVKSFWSYTPAKRGDTPVDGWTTTPIEFQVSE
jgi:protein TonB